MKVATESFKQALVDFREVVRKRVIHPLLGCISIQFAEEDLILTAIDVDLKLQIRMDSQTDRPIGEYHTLVIPYNALIPFKWATITAEEINLSCSDLDLEIRYEKEKHLIPGVKPNDFPDFGVPASSEIKGCFHINQKEVKNVLDLCSQYACPNPANTNLTGIYIRVENDRAIAEATDGHHWVIQSKFPVSSENTFGCVIPSFLPAKLLKLQQRWKQLTIAVHEDCVMAVNETLNMRFEVMTTMLGSKYPPVDHLFRHTTSDSVVSTIDPHHLVRFLKGMDKQYKHAIILTENKNFRAYGVSDDNMAPHTSLDRKGDGFACAGLSADKLMQLCTVSKSVKEIIFHINKEFRDPLPVVIEYSYEECSFTIGLIQMEFKENTYWHDARQGLIYYFDSSPEEATEEEEVEDTFSVTDDMFPDGFFDADDRSDDDQEIGE